MSTNPVADEVWRTMASLVIDNRARREEWDPTGKTIAVESGASFAGFARKMCRSGPDGLAY